MRQILCRGEFKKDLEMSFGILGNLEHSLLGVEFPEQLLSFDMIFIVNKIVQERVQITFNVLRWVGSLSETFLIHNIVAFKTDVNLQAMIKRKLYVYICKDP